MERAERSAKLAVLPASAGVGTREAWTRSDGEVGLSQWGCGHTGGESSAVSNVQAIPTRQLGEREGGRGNAWLWCDRGATCSGWIVIVGRAHAALQVVTKQCLMGEKGAICEWRDRKCVLEAGGPQGKDQVMRGKRRVRSADGRLRTLLNWGSRELSAGFRRERHYNRRNGEDGSAPERWGK